jgi:hypothetical protein
MLIMYNNCQCDHRADEVRATIETEDEVEHEAT